MLRRTILYAAPGRRRSSSPDATALVNGVDAIGLTVSDLDRSVEFYSTVLHFEKVSETEVDGDSYEHLTRSVRSAACGSRACGWATSIIELTEFLAPQRQARAGRRAQQ